MELSSSIILYGHGMPCPYKISNNLENPSQVPYLPLSVHSNPPPPNGSTNTKIPLVIPSGNGIITNMLSAMKKTYTIFANISPTIPKIGKRTKIICKSTKRKCRDTACRAPTNPSIIPTYIPTSPVINVKTNARNNCPNIPVTNIQTNNSCWGNS